MEFAIRLLLYVVIGLLLVVANLWFVRSVHTYFLSTDYVIAPFNVLDPSGRTAIAKAGEALAQMLASRLTNIQAGLEVAQAAATRQPNPGPDPNELPAVTTLFISRAVDIPTGLFQPVEIDVEVGGVEVGGLLSWVQRTLARRRVLTFTTYEKGDRAIVSADLGGFARSGGHVWFESDRDPDEIATNAAYALIQRKLADKQLGRVETLELADFRALLETVFEVERLNRLVARGYVVEDRFAGLLSRIEALSQKTPDWPELTYLIASIADGAGNHAKAIVRYRKLQTPQVERTADPKIVRWAAQRLAELGQVAEAVDAEAQERFVSAARDFARLMGLEGPEPAIAFVESEHPGVQALWQAQQQRYEVDPRAIGTPGLPQYVALMGRFLARVYERCFGQNNQPDPGLMQIWNDFRWGVANYLIQSVPEFRGVKLAGEGTALFKALKRMEVAVGTEPVQRLALELMRRFDCDWRQANLKDKMLAINQERGLMPRTVIESALTAEGIGAGAHAG